MPPCRGTYLVPKKFTSHIKRWEVHWLQDSDFFFLLFFPFSTSVPKALSALAVSDSDEEDQESTPVIINGDSAGSGAKPTAPMPESSADNGKSFPSYFSIYVSKYVRPGGIFPNQGGHDFVVGMLSWLE